MPLVTCCDHTLEFPKASASNACTSFLEFWKPAVEHVQDDTALVQPLTAKPAIAPWLVKISQSLWCGKIQQCCSNLPLVCEWKELVLCSPSICFRPVKPLKPFCRQDRRIINFCLIWKRQNTFKLPARLHIKRQAATSLVRRIVSPLPWYVSLCPVDFVKTRHSNTLLQECRGILGMSTRTSACFAPFPHALRLNCWLLSEKEFYLCLPAHPEDLGAEP